MRPSLVPELSVTDLAASLRFYRDILGFAVLYGRPDEGFAYLALGPSEIMLDQLGTGRDWVTAPLERPFGRGINLQLEVAALTPLLESLSAAGVGLFQPLEDKTYTAGDEALHQRQFCVKDPDGYLLRFFERLP